MHSKIDMTSSEYPVSAPGGEVVVYEAPDGEARVDMRLEQETVWLTQRQMAEVLQTSTDNVSLHLRNIYSNGELEESETTEDFSTVRTEGIRQVRRVLKHYNLDAIISVGYRVNSRRGVRFRQWATRTLREHLVRGFTVNERRLAERGLREARETLDLLSRTLLNQALVDDTGQAGLGLIASYADTWRLLLEYDEDRLTTPPGAKPATSALDHDHAVNAIAQFKRELATRGEASPLFGNPRGDALAAILGNIEQTMFGESLYRSREEKAAHLFYFVVKDHPFTDGNKRIGSLLFLLYLKQEGVAHRLNPQARANPELWGRLVESAVGAHLANAAAAGTCEVFYWRERNREVDFVVRAGAGGDGDRGQERTRSRDAAGHGRGSPAPFGRPASCLSAAMASPSTSSCRSRWSIGYEAGRRGPPAQSSGPDRVPPADCRKRGWRQGPDGPPHRQSSGGAEEMNAFTESVVEQAALDWFRALGYDVVGGPDMPPGLHALRESYADTIFPSVVRGALARLNPNLPNEALDDAFRKLTRPEGSSPEARNHAFHRLAVDGVTVEYRDAGGSIRGAPVRMFDFEEPSNNDWLVVNQFTVVEGNHERRPDIVLFVNGLPLAVVELKNPADEDATLRSAWQQLRTYQAELPSLFTFNAVLAVSDGVEARLGTLTAGWEWFKPWRTISGEELAPVFLTQLQVAIEGAFEKRRFLALLRDFIVFEDDGGGHLAKKMAGYHQFHAVETAVGETLRAAELRVREEAGRYESGRMPGGNPGDRRIGVVWHTQGSGKSLTMAFYTGRIIREPAMANPTMVVLTDRNDLDDQLFGTFARCRDLLRQPPAQADSRADLRSKLAVEAGGVVFTTIQKFLPPSAAPSPRPSPTGRGSREQGDRHPLLSERRNIVVIADEAHRSQYDFIDGFARHMRDALPNASFIGFTGTPIELQDANTRAVFGDYISIYDIQRAVEDRATVPIYYESRLAKLALDERERPRIDPGFEEATEGEEVDRKEKLKTRWAQLEAVVGAEQRLELVAGDIVAHFEQRTEAMDGKAMIVCMSRRICMDLYRELTRLRPDWHDADDDKGRIKVVMTGAASDPPDWQPHIRNKPRRETLASRFRDPGDPLQVALVRDIWLTGFDAPSLHTMYVDKPMRGHGLMQAIARVKPRVQG